MDPLTCNSNPSITITGATDIRIGDHMFPHTHGTTLFDTTILKIKLVYNSELQNNSGHWQLQKMNESMTNNEAIGFTGG